MQFDLFFATDASSSSSSLFVSRRKMFQIIFKSFFHFICAQNTEERIIIFLLSLHRFSRMLPYSFRLCWLSRRWFDSSFIVMATVWSHHRRRKVQYFGKAHRTYTRHNGIWNEITINHRPLCIHRRREILFIKIHKFITVTDWSCVSVYSERNGE